MIFRVLFPCIIRDSLVNHECKGYLQCIILAHYSIILFVVDCGTFIPILHHFEHLSKLPRKPQKPLGLLFTWSAIPSQMFGKYGENERL